MTRTAFEYLHNKKGDLSVTTFETTFETFRDREPARTDNSVWEIVYTMCVYHSEICFSFIMIIYTTVNYI